MTFDDKLRPNREVYYFNRSAKDLNLHAVLPYPNIRWFEVKPRANDYNNFRHCEKKPTEKNCTQPLIYDEREIYGLRDRRAFKILEHKSFSSAGTHLFLVEAGGKRSPIFRWIVRENDTYLGYLSELIGVPFVYFPKVTVNGKHQTDQHLGADCAALIVYGKRRQGYGVPYVAPAGLLKFMETIGTSEDLKSTKVREGDVLYFGFQTAVLYEDRAPKGTLDENDVILQTYHEVAETRSLSQLPYRKSHFQILRWL